MMCYLMNFFFGVGGFSVFDEEITQCLKKLKANEKEKQIFTDMKTQVYKCEDMTVLLMIICTCLVYDLWCLNTIKYLNVTKNIKAPLKLTKIVRYGR